MSQTKALSLLVGAGIALGSASVASAEVSQSPDEIRAIVAEMMADANNRSSLLQSGGDAGHDGKFFLGSSDGNFRLNVSGQVQFRYIANFGDQNNASDGDDYTGGFQARRTKLAFSGNVINSDIFYKVNGAFNRNGGNFSLEDAYVGYKFGNGWEVQWGQFKSPFLREELVSSSRQLAAERSITNEVFTGNRTQGIQLAYKAEDWRAFFSFNDGFNSANTDFNGDNPGFGFIGGVAPGSFEPAAVNNGGGEADFGFTARAEFKLAGDWNQFKDFTSKAGSDYAAMIGVAANYETNETAASNTGVGNGSVDAFAYTIDVSVEGDGWNFFAAFIGTSNDFDGHDIDADGVAESGDFSDFGVVVQAGMFIPDTDWEFFVRYDAIFPEDDRTTDDTYSSLTFGLNWYWSGHAAKFTLDAVIFLDESLAGGGQPGNALVGAPDTALGLVGDDDEGELAIRAQFQLLF